MCAGYIYINTHTHTNTHAYKYIYTSHKRTLCVYPHECALHVIPGILQTTARLSTGRSLHLGEDSAEDRTGCNPDNSVPCEPAEQYRLMGGRIDAALSRQTRETVRLAADPQATSKQQSLTAGRQQQARTPARKPSYGVSKGRIERGASREPEENGADRAVIV
jgi:hypothetical protein